MERRGKDGRGLVDHARRRRWVTLLQRVLAALGVVLACGVWGLSTASAEASLGPHVARWEVTLDHDVTVDFGPLGSLVVPSPLPATLGARIVVQEIPREITALGGATTLEALSNDLQEYVQLFGAPHATLAVAVEALVWNAITRTVTALVVVVGVGWSVRRLLGPARRRELLEGLAESRHVLLGSVLVVTMVAGTVVASDIAPAADEPVQTASAVFDGTPLEGARLTGRLAGVLDTYGGQVVGAYRQNEQFYETATARLREAWEDRMRSEQAIAAFRESVATASAPGEGLGTPGPDSTGEPEQGEDGDPPAEPTQEAVTLLVVSDLHCNVGMARVIGAAAELSGATVVLDAGDVTMNGTAVEAYCVRAFAQALPPGVTTVFAGGNHDSDLTATQARDAGAVVLSGTVVEVGGVRIIGDVDPRETRVGSGTAAISPETVGELGSRLSERACADPAGVDLLLIHDVRAGQALDDGCVPVQVSGHYHRRIGPFSAGDGVRYVSSSTAGARLGLPTVGPLSGVAEMTLLRFSPASRTWLDYRLIQVRPDRSVNVGFAVRWPGTPLDPRPVGGPR